MPGVKHPYILQAEILNFDCNAALSPAIGGYLAEHFGFATAFLVFGCVAIVAIPAFLGVRIDTDAHG